MCVYCLYCIRYVFFFVFFEMRIRRASTPFEHSTSACGRNKSPRRRWIRGYENDNKNKKTKLRFRTCESSFYLIHNIRSTLSIILLLYVPTYWKEVYIIYVYIIYLCAGYLWKKVWKRYIHKGFTYYIKWLDNNDNR